MFGSHITKYLNAGTLPKRATNVTKASTSTEITTARSKPMSFEIKIVSGSKKAYDNYALMKMQYKCLKPVDSWSSLASKRLPDCCNEATKKQRSCKATCSLISFVHV